MRVNEASIKRTAVNLCLLLVSCVAGLVLCEVSLRLFYPKYRYVAEAPFHSDAMRIWARTPNSRDWRNHPDTFVPHSYRHNNLALRQHRDFRAADLAAATNIGIFGDSFTENVGMPVQYSFTEPLDYLLNQSGERFNVLNFGVDGYGPGQSLLHYEHFRYVEDLDHVLYVYCENDLLGIHKEGLFYLDEAGHLVRNEAIRESWYAPLIRRFHMPYLILDVIGRRSSLSAEAAGDAEYPQRGSGERFEDERRWGLLRAIRRGRPAYDDRKNTLETFLQLIRYWKHLAEDNGSTFSVVLLPSHPPRPFVVALLNAEDVEIIDLYACFGAHDPAHHDRAWADSPYRFRKDGHWNEAGNQLAALCLYRFLEENVGLPRLSEERLWETVSRYYAAFEDETPLKAGERGGRVEGAVSLEAAAAIREKYLALDMRTPSKEEFLKGMVQQSRRLIASDFDVYLHRGDLFYIRADCRRRDLDAPFFLYSIPVDKSDLPENLHRKGFERSQFVLSSRNFGTEQHTCFTKIKLSQRFYPVRYIRTGQYVPDEGRLWEGEAWLEPPSVGEERPKFPVAAGKRIIQSDFDVYLDGQQLVYHKADCGPVDREAPFFLQVTPTDATVLPPDRGHPGFESLDFNNCTIERRLPAYAIRHIRTGQFTDAGRLWEVEFRLEPASGSRGDESAAPFQRTVRSVFDVAFDGQRLIYSKAECRPADWEAPFFLHVTPVDDIRLSPTRVQWGFENLDFQYRPGSEFKVDEFGCTIGKRLPAYAIRHIRTGQSMPGKGRLWEGEFAIKGKERE